MKKDKVSPYIYGLVSPDGEFYKCEFGGHGDLIKELGLEESDIDDLGWLRVSGQKLGIHRGMNKMTDKQLNWIYEIMNIFSENDKNSIINSLNQYFVDAEYYSTIDGSGY